MLATVVVTIASHNLAAGVGVGVVLSGVLFAVKVSRLLEVSAEDDATGLRIWRVSGQVFFASADAFLEAFDILDVEQRPVRIDVSRAHFWDITAVAALEQLVERLRHHGCQVEVVGLNEASAVLIDRLGARGAG
jgi:SulP family sulfate permease